KDVLSKSTQFLREKGSETARLDSELLIASALRWQRIKLYLNHEYPLSDDELKACRENVRRRGTGEPVAYIVGEKDFYRSTFQVSAAVLIPRPETEALVEEAITYCLQREKSLASQIHVLDLGTGSGCIGLSILTEVPSAKLTAVDISSEAISVAV